MTMTDPIADMLARLRNANSAYHEDVAMPHSKIKANIAEILKEQGYIASFDVADAEVGKTLTLNLKYRPVPREVDRGVASCLKARIARIRKEHERCPRYSVGSASPSCPPRPDCSLTARPRRKA